MRPITISMAPSATDADGICASQTPSGASNLTINGVLASGGVATLGAVSAVTITGGSDESGKTFTVYGTDHYGLAISESITGPNATTVVSTKSYKTITQIAVSAATTGAITVGVNGTGISRAIPLDIHNQAGFFVNMGIDVTGTIDLTVQHTFDDPFTSTFNNYAATWLDHPDLIGVTADQDGFYEQPVRAVRVVVNSSASGSATLTLVQAG